MGRSLSFTLICIINNIIKIKKIHKASHFYCKQDSLMISKSKQLFFIELLILCLVFSFSPISFAFIYFNSDHFWEIITQKCGGPDETAIQLLRDVIYQPLFVSVLITLCKEEDEDVEEDTSWLVWVCEEARENKHTEGIWNIWNVSQVL